MDCFSNGVFSNGLFKKVLIRLAADAVSCGGCGATGQMMGLLPQFCSPGKALIRIPGFERKAFPIVGAQCQSGINVGKEPFLIEDQR